MGEPKTWWSQPDTQTEYTEVGRGRGKDKQRQGRRLRLHHTPGAEILMALQAGFSSVINSHSIARFQRAGQPPSTLATHSINWGTMKGIYFRHRFANSSKCGEPATLSTAPWTDGFCRHCTRGGPAALPQTEGRRTGSVVPSLFHSTSILGTCSAPSHQGRNVGTGKML